MEFILWYELMTDFKIVFFSKGVNITIQIYKFVFMKTSFHYFVKYKMRKENKISHN